MTWSVATPIRQSSFTAENISWRYLAINTSILGSSFFRSLLIGIMLNERRCLRQKMFYWRYKARIAVSLRQILRWGMFGEGTEAAIVLKAMHGFNNCLRSSNFGNWETSYFNSKRLQVLISTFHNNKLVYKHHLLVMIS